MLQKPNENGAWRRLHVTHILHSKLLLFPPAAFLVGIVVVLGMNVDSEIGLPLVVFGIGLAINLIWYLPIFGYLLLRRLAYRYQFHDDRLVVRRGLVAITDKVVLYERLHGVDTTRSLLHRLFGTVRVSLNTRSVTFEGIDLQSVKLSVAEEFRERLNSYQNRQTHQLVSALDAKWTNQDTADSATHLHSMSMLECCKLGFVRSRTALILSIIATFIVSRFSQLGSLLGDSTFRFPIGPVDLKFIGGWIPWIEISLLHGVDAWELSVFLAAILGVFLLILTCMSLVFAFVQFYNFQLALDNSILRGESGLLIRAVQNTPLHRVQAIRILSTIRSRLVDRESIWFGTSAMPPMEKNSNLSSSLSTLSNWLVPLIPASRTREIARCVLPLDVDFEKEKWEALDVARVWRRRLNLHLIYVLVLAAVFAFVSLWLLIAIPFIVGWAVLVARLYAKSVRFQLLDNAIMVRKGYWSRTWTIVPFDKIQAVRLTQSLLDRRWCMSTLGVDVATYGPMNIPRFLLRIPYVSMDRCRELQDILIRESSQRKDEW